jgi:hypothetical protein
VLILERDEQETEKEVNQRRRDSSTPEYDVTEQHKAEHGSIFIINMSRDCNENSIST